MGERTSCKFGGSADSFGSVDDRQDTAALMSEHWMPLSGIPRLLRQLNGSRGNADSVMVQKVLSSEMPLREQLRPGFAEALLSVETYSA